jgi:lipoprotein NlpD
MGSCSGLSPSRTAAKLRNRRSPIVLALACLAAALTAGCIAERGAPVIERTSGARPAPVKPATGAVTTPAPKPGEIRPEFYTVRKSDTLYSIALDQGLDYRDLAQWNGITDPAVISVGQILRLTAPETTVTTAPLQTAPGVQARPLGETPIAPGTEVAPPAAAPASPPPAAAPTSPPTVSGTAVAPPAAAAASPPVAASGSVVNQPKAVRSPYSDQVYAQLSAAKPVLAPKTDPPAAAGDGSDNVNWGWPASGSVVNSYNESATLKGIGIAGKLGQPVVASAAGRVIFSGMGIRGFGKLIVIKHNNTFLSVYGHNSELLVKEGQNVSKGQKIAEMGSTDTDRVKLHFEIRRLGKPVDPVKLLPPA